jgi:hypothetical protein
LGRIPLSPRPQSSGAAAGFALFLLLSAGRVIRHGAPLHAFIRTATSQRIQVSLSALVPSLVRHSETQSENNNAKQRLIVGAKKLQPRLMRWVYIGVQLKVRVKCHASEAGS